MGCVAGVNSVEDVRQARSSGGKAQTQHEVDFHAKYVLGERIGKGAYAVVHAVSEKTHADGLRVGAKVRVQIERPDTVRDIVYNGLRGEIVKHKMQQSRWQVRLDAYGKVALWWTKSKHLILEKGASKKASSKASRAVKIRDLGNSESGDDFGLCGSTVQSCKDEVCIWKKIMSHTNILKLHEVFFDKYLCYMVMERCKGSLFKYMGGLPVLNERSIGELLVQMIRAINHLHSYRVVHRDVKPDNLMMGGPEGSTVKLCDYGLSEVLPEAGKLTRVRGAAPYMCPEMIQLRLSDEKADVWSVGVVAYLLLCGTFPYQPSYDKWTRKKMQQMILVGGRPKCERSWLSKSAASMLGKMLTRQPSLRPTANEALCLPFIVDAALDSKVPVENLPCLRPVLEAAVLLGTGENSLDREYGLDTYLNLKQVKSHGREVPPSDPSDILELPPCEDDWVKAQEIALVRAMACNIAEAYATGMPSSSSDLEKFSSNASKTSESNAHACGSSCFMDVEQNPEVTVFNDHRFLDKIEG